MRGTPRTLALGLIAAALVAGACGGGDNSIAGTYNCTIEGFPEASVDALELREDRTLEFRPEGAPAPIEGTWSAERDSVVITREGRDETFAIEDDRLVGVTGGGDRYVCTPG
jgi:hypothetical protein